MSKKSAKPAAYPEFLKELLEAKSPTGHEFAAQKVIDDHVEKSADKYSKDALGNRIAELKGDGGPTLMFAGHIDEIGLIISHVDDKGYLYFEFLGGHDQIIPSGRRLHILTRNGPVLGITGKRAVHLLSPEDRKRVPERHDMWIDIGVNNRADALAIVRIGDPAVYTDGPEILRGSIGVARAFDDKAGAYVCMEAFRRLSKEKKLAARVVSVATTQEEIGTRGAQVAAQGSTLTSPSPSTSATPPPTPTPIIASSAASPFPAVPSSPAARTSTRSSTTRWSKPPSRSASLTRSAPSRVRPVPTPVPSRWPAPASPAACSPSLSATCTPRAKSSTSTSSSSPSSSSSNSPAA